MPCHPPTRRGPAHHRAGIPQRLRHVAHPRTVEPGKKRRRKTSRRRQTAARRLAKSRPSNRSLPRLLRVSPLLCNTGIVTGTVRALDIDIDDADLCRHYLDAALGRSGLFDSYVAGADTVPRPLQFIQMPACVPLRRSDPWQGLSGRRPRAQGRNPGQRAAIHMPMAGTRQT